MNWLRPVFNSREICCIEQSVLLRDTDNSVRFRLTRTGAFDRSGARSDRVAQSVDIGAPRTMQKGFGFPMKRIWVSFVAAAFMTVAVFAPAAAQDTVTIDMQEVDESGQSGSADITSDGEQVTVSIEIDAGPDGQPQPVHIHEGDCRNLGDVAFPLEDVVDGVSESTADVSMSELLAGEYAINVHLSEDQMDVYVACGTLPLIGGGPSDDDSDEAAEEEDEEASEEDEATEDDDEAVEEDDDEAAEEDDDAATEDDDEAAEEDDDAATEDDEDDEAAEDLVPATGGEGMGAESAVMLMTLLSGTALGAGLLVRRRFAQV